MIANISDRILETNINRDANDVIRVYSAMYVKYLKEFARGFPKSQVKRFIPWIFNGHDLTVVYVQVDNENYDLDIYLIKTLNTDKSEAIDKSSISIEDLEELEKMKEKKLPLDIPLRHMNPVNARNKAAHVINSIMNIAHYLG